eukprot:g46160.t1
MGATNGTLNFGESRNATELLCSFPLLPRRDAKVDKSWSSVEEHICDLLNGCPHSSLADIAHVPGGTLKGSSAKKIQRSGHFHFDRQGCPSSGVRLKIFTKEFAQIGNGTLGQSHSSNAEILRQVFKGSALPVDTL